MANPLLVLLVTIILLLGGLSCSPSFAPVPSGTTPSVTTGTTLPVISEIRYFNLDLTTVTVGWKTNVPTIGRVEYGTAGVYDLTTEGNKELNTIAASILTDLEPFTLYNVRVRVRDAAGNEAVLEGTTFMTYFALSGGMG